MLISKVILKPCYCNELLCCWRWLSSQTGSHWTCRLSLRFRRWARQSDSTVKPQHHIVQSVGRGDPLTGVYALLWSGFGSPWQHVCSHPALSKVSAGTSSRAEHMWGCVPIIIVTTANGPFFFLDRLFLMIWESFCAINCIVMRKLLKVAHWAIRKVSNGHFGNNPLSLWGNDWWWEYEEGIRHYSKEALNKVLFTPGFITLKR